MFDLFDTTNTETRYTLEIITRWDATSYDSQVVRDETGEAAVYTGEQTAMDAALALYEQTDQAVLVVDEHRDIVASVG